MWRRSAGSGWAVTETSEQADRDRLPAPGEIQGGIAEDEVDTNAGPIVTDRSADLPRIGDGGLGGGTAAGTGGAAGASGDVERPAADEDVR